MEEQTQQVTAPGVTMLDVARCAGVSQKTVSRVVNGEGPVRAATRARVLRAVRDLGYSPDTAAQALARRRRRDGAEVAP